MQGKSIKLSETVEVTKNKPVIIECKSEEEYEIKLEKLLKTVLNECDKDKVLIYGCGITGTEEREKVLETLHKLEDNYKVKRVNASMIWNRETKNNYNDYVIIGLGLLCHTIFCADHIYYSNNYLIHIQGQLYRGELYDPEIKEYVITDF
ncbi:MAG: hypothetical protein IJC02_01965 [Lachnospiraceae bacterium]|nr:hypothetical protein [Lachnospiraceae bacterium]